VALTRVGFGGPSADYAGFVAKDAVIYTASPERLYVVPHEDRVYVVPNEIRRLIVPGGR
jgi:hypothetical protein